MAPLVFIDIQQSWISIKTRGIPPSENNKLLVFILYCLGIDNGQRDIIKLDSLMIKTNGQNTLPLPGSKVGVKNDFNLSNNINLIPEIHKLTLKRFAVIGYFFFHFFTNQALK